MPEVINVLKAAAEAETIKHALMRTFRFEESEIEIDIHEADEDGPGKFTIDAVSTFIVFRAVSPHEGNDYKYLIRFACRATFDRWANSTAVEELFNTAGNAVKYITENYTDIYEAVLSDAVDGYIIAAKGYKVIYQEAQNIMSPERAKKVLEDGEWWNHLDDVDPDNPPKWMTELDKATDVCSIYFSGVDDRLFL